MRSQTLPPSPLVFSSNVRRCFRYTCSARASYHLIGKWNMMFPISYSFLFKFKWSLKINYESFGSHKYIRRLCLWSCAITPRFLSGHDAMQAFPVTCSSAETWMDAWRRAEVPGRTSWPKSCVREVGYVRAPVLLQSLLQHPPPDHVWSRF